MLCDPRLILAIVESQPVRDPGSQMLHDQAPTIPQGLDPHVEIPLETGPRSGPHPPPETVAGIVAGTG
eukprot:11205232-Lingulodinium_polyedra.AAC.1